MVYILGSCHSACLDDILRYGTVSGRSDASVAGDERLEVMVGTKLY